MHMHAQITNELQWYLGSSKSDENGLEKNNALENTSKNASRNREWMERDDKSLVDMYVNLKLNETRCCYWIG